MISVQRYVDPIPQSSGLMAVNGPKQLNVKKRPRRYCFSPTRAGYRRVRRTVPRGIRHGEIVSVPDRCLAVSGLIVCAVLVHPVGSFAFGTH